MLQLGDTYVAPQANIWQGRRDSLPKERFFQNVNCHDLRKKPLLATRQRNTIALLGFACDAGIKRNFGRTGAALGPDALRGQLAPLAVQGNLDIIDVGNIMCLHDDLERAQQDLAQVVTYLQQQGLKTIILGGGHEMAWGHYQGLAPIIKHHRFGIINFDAHFDLRPCPQEHYGTSGTPFLQIATARTAQHLNFDYCCIGIQTASNTTSLFNTAAAYHSHILTAAQLYQLPQQDHLTFLADFLNQHAMIYLTICLDVFGQSDAPGVSAPQALGLSPWQVMPLLHAIVQSGKVLSIDIAELSPPHDEHDKTARLAANLVAELCYHWP